MSCFPITTLPKWDYKVLLHIIKKESLTDSFFNGGTDAYRFELFERYYNHLRTNDSKKICYLINKLMKVA